MEEFLVESLLDVMHQNHGHAMMIILRSTCPPNHLEHISDGHVYVSFQFAVVELSSLDDDKMGGEVDPQATVAVAIRTWIFMLT